MRRRSQPAQLAMAAGAHAAGMHHAGHCAAVGIVAGTSGADVGDRIDRVRRWWQEACVWQDVDDRVPAVG